MTILKGYTVLDCSIAMAGPLAAQRLGDLGADVIKIEPVNGEWQRHTAAGDAKGNEINVSFLSLNRNKRSLAIDLKSDEGHKIIRQLVAKSDVFIQNYRAGVADRLGVDYDTLAAINPNLVYVSMSGFGETGPYVKRPGQDLLLQAMSGAMLSAGRKGEAPQAAGQYLVDAVTAYSAFEGALAALLHRERTGEGQKVEVNMLDAITTLQMQELSVFTVGGVPQTRSDEPHAHSYIRAPYGTFKTRNGYIAIAMPDFDGLSRALDAPALSGLDVDQAGWTDRDQTFAMVREAVVKFNTDDVLKRLEAEGVWSGPVYSYADLVADPQIAHNQTFVEYDHPTEGRVKTPGFPIRFGRTPSSIRYGAPLTGEHTDDILKDLGVSEQDIQSLADTGVIGRREK
ncbi:CaiB/BaiF CoA transferase family protein [Pacificibacter marinus]|uniref:Formyl-coenzyme A transferase n=1 Tax=Pacificibacter marinus TaxID=658057 RepID=A0A1Y5RQG9_9RHOB|nr:CoA transferase [Pacificibacter marinus]SEL30728.1 Crotonobetainyl-CoA:carnitine CoA-transferase CaiB [Pacificibacter marinus]SLN22063.1 Formyl-coenzyme A transferase [Pacificibacter marinus]